MMDIPSETSLSISAIITKYGAVKLLTIGSALAGAGLMAMARPPKNRRELFQQAAVAGGLSLFLGDTVAQFIDYWFDAISLASSPREVVINFVVAVHFLVGAASWGLWGGLAALRDRFAKDPVQTVKDVKDI